MERLTIRIPCACGVLVHVEFYRGQRVTCAACEKKAKTVKEPR